MARLEYLIQQDPTILARMAQVEAQTQAYIEAQRHLPHGRTNNVITIPVVVHIVYRTAAQNISDAQVAVAHNYLHLQILANREERP